MMNKRLAIRLIAVVSAVVLLISAVITLAGGRVSWIPTWEELFILSGFRETDVSSEELRVTVLPLGDADCLIIQNGEHAALIDAGNANNQRAIISALRLRGIRRLDLVLATHFDSDHIGSMDAVVREFEIGTFLAPHVDVSCRPTHPAYNNLQEALNKKNLAMTDARIYSEYAIGDAVLTMLTESKVGIEAEGNALSLVCRLTFGKRSLLLMSDADKDIEEALLLNQTPLRSDVLKVGHHGSSDASTLSFLEAVAPSYAVITCRQLSTSHPHRKTLDALHTVGSAIFRTDLHGEITIVTNGETLTVTGKTS